MKKMLTRYEINRLLDKGCTIEVGQTLEAYRVSFRPFENTLSDAERDLYKQIMRGDEEVTGSGWDLQVFAESLYSTVYRGWRFYFDTPQKLREFCECLER